LGSAARKTSFSHGFGPPDLTSASDCKSHSILLNSPVARQSLGAELRFELRFCPRTRRPERKHHTRLAYSDWAWAAGIT
jgi:hypothetical protein